jgi:hypothetical protein
MYGRPTSRAKVSVEVKPYQHIPLVIWPPVRRHADTLVWSDDPGSIGTAIGLWPRRGESDEQPGPSKRPPDRPIVALGRPNLGANLLLRPTTRAAFCGSKPAPSPGQRRRRRPHRDRGGCNLDTTRGQPGFKSHEWLTNPFRKLIEDAVRAATPRGSTEPDPTDLAMHPIFRLTPFIETMGQTQDGRRKEFWWEREWRKVSSLDFNPAAVVAAVTPTRDHDNLRTALSAVPGYAKLRLVDPAWDAGTIEAALDGVNTGPFPA